MKPCASMPLRTGETARIVHWVRCVRCQHATIAGIQTLFERATVPAVSDPERYTPVPSLRAL